MTDHPDIPDGTISATGAGPKVVPMIPKNDLAAAVENLRRNIDPLIANQLLLARLRRASYLALIEAGFAESQALELCTK